MRLRVQVHPNRVFFNAFFCFFCFFFLAISATTLLASPRDFRLVHSLERPRALFFPFLYCLHVCPSNVAFRRLMPQRRGRSSEIPSIVSCNSSRESDGRLFLRSRLRGGAAYSSRSMGRTPLFCLGTSFCGSDLVWLHPTVLLPPRCMLHTTPATFVVCLRRPEFFFCLQHLDNSPRFVRACSPRRGHACIRPSLCLRCRLLSLRNATGVPQ